MQLGPPVVPVAAVDQTGIPQQFVTDTQKHGPVIARKKLSFCFIILKLSVVCGGSEWLADGVCSRVHAGADGSWEPLCCFGVYGCCWFGSQYRSTDVDINMPPGESSSVPRVRNTYCPLLQQSTVVVLCKAYASATSSDLNSSRGHLVSCTLHEQLLQAAASG